MRDTTQWKTDIDVTPVLCIYRLPQLDWYLINTEFASQYVKPCKEVLVPSLVPETVHTTMAAEIFTTLGSSPLKWDAFDCNCSC